MPSQMIKKLLLDVSVIGMAFQTSFLSRIISCII